jgi:DNA-binding CsgD family transcriptional regulator
MTQVPHIKFKEKIKEHETAGNLLEAFLIQSAYVESLLRRLFNYQLAITISDASIRKAVKGKNQHLSSVIKFSFEAGWLIKGEYDNAEAYIKERNSIVHDLIASNSSALDERLRALLKRGQSILEGHGSLERFMNLAQLEYTSGKMVPTNQVLNLTSRERNVFELRFSGKTLEEIGATLGVTRERVRQIQNSAIQKMEGLVSASVEKTAAVAQTKIAASIAEAKKATSLSKAKIAVLKSADAFIADICQSQGIEISSLRGKSRKADLVFVRHWIAYTLRERFKLSYPVIGAKLNRDHTTIIHAHKRIAALMKERKAV